MNDTASPESAELPLVSMLLIAYRQSATVGEAIRGALAQDYPRLEILVSDDASGDGTWDAIQAAVAGYDGPHRLRLNRNERNLGIGAHLSRLASMADGELLFVAAGDDVSLPQRCSRTVQAWNAHGRRPDLIAAALEDIDDEGRSHGRLQPDDLSRYRSAADWVARPPYVVGAAQAWTKRLLDRFGPLPEGTVAEDLVMVLRAVMAGGAITLDESLVRYRRGGLSARRRAMSADEVRTKWLKNARHSLVELPQMLADARRAGCEAMVAPELNRQLARERHVHDQLVDPAFGARLRRLRVDTGVPASLRLRVFVYAALPALVAPMFALKRLATRRR